MHNHPNLLLLTQATIFQVAIVKSCQVRSKIYQIPLTYLTPPSCPLVPKTLYKIDYCAHYFSVCKKRLIFLEIDPGCFLATANRDESY